MTSQPEGISGTWSDRARYKRGRRALERQLEYQTDKSRTIRGHEDDLSRINFVRAQFIRQQLEEVRPIMPDDKVLEVGSGVTGLIFNFPGSFGVGVDPLAVDYKRLFPTIQRDVPTIAGIGEQLPFADAAFDIVLSDNVIDHAERPLAIPGELVRVLKPGGLLYFTVNVHHPFYDAASRMHGLWNALGLKLELSPFADHTVHLTEDRISREMRRLPLTVVRESSTVAETRRMQRRESTKRLDTLVRRMFFKNALYELIAVRN